jgi:hypothetical protein
MRQNRFEEKLFILLMEGPYFEFDGDVSLITPESCCNSIKHYAPEIEWKEEAIQHKLRQTDLPSFVASAVMVAWETVDWDRMCDRVTNDLLGHVVES